MADLQKILSMRSDSGNSSPTPSQETVIEAAIQDVKNTLIAAQSLGVQPEEIVSRAVGEFNLSRGVSW